MPHLSDRTAWRLGDAFHCLETPARSSHPIRLVLLGPPGVGKGTQARLLAETFGACPLATGDLFRELLDHETAVGAFAADRIHRGQLLPDDLVISLIRNRRTCFHCAAGFILDGFPRTVSQAVAFDGLLAAEQLRLDVVLHYTLPLPGLVARVIGRRLCPRCHALYNEVTRPPHRSGVCDDCGTELVRRPADGPTLQHERLAEHTAAVAAVADHYRRQNLLVEIDAAAEPDAIFRQTFTHLAARGLRAEAASVAVH